jgi:hypothetical protein
LSEKFFLLLPIFERAGKIWEKLFEGVQRAMIQAG